MNPLLLPRITKAVALAGVALTIIATMLYGLRGLAGGAAGVGIALANWQAIRWLAEQLQKRNVRSRGRLMILATLKTGALMAICWIALTRVGLDAKSFIVGISALVVGILVGPLTLPEQPLEDEANNHG